MLRQIIKVIRLLGVSKAVRMKRHHEQGLAYVRGYSACCCWWALLNNGFLDELMRRGSVDLAEYVKEHDCAGAVMEAIVEYLHGIGLLERYHGLVRLSKAGQVLLAEPRGMFELLWAYEPCLSSLGDLLAGEQVYGRDLTRRITYVGMGSGRLCEQLPYPVMRRMVLDHGCRMVLDLGCGDMAFLAGLCRMDNNIRGHGIDCSEEMVGYCRDQLRRNDYGGRLTVQPGDMFDLPELPGQLPAVDCVTACDTFHEYLGGQEKQIVQLLKGLSGRWPRALFVIGEFCLQDASWLRKHPTVSLEHHLFHQLTEQQIGTARQWRDIFSRAGLAVVEEQVYDLIGHGYFALRRQAEA